MPPTTIITTSIARCLFRQAMSPRRRGSKKYRDNLWYRQNRKCRRRPPVERGWPAKARRSEKVSILFGRFFFFHLSSDIRARAHRNESRIARIGGRKLISTCRLMDKKLLVQLAARVTSARAPVTETVQRHKVKLPYRGFANCVRRVDAGKGGLAVEKQHGSRNKCLRVYTGRKFVPPWKTARQCPSFAKFALYLIKRIRVLRALELILSQLLLIQNGKHDSGFLYFIWKENERERERDEFEKVFAINWYRIPSLAFRSRKMQLKNITYIHINIILYTSLFEEYQSQCSKHKHER